MADVVALPRGLRRAGHLLAEAALDRRDHARGVVLGLGVGHERLLVQLA